MKILFVLALVALATKAHCFPGPSDRPAKDDEVEILPLGKHHNPFGIIDVDASDAEDDDDFPGLGQGWRDSFSAFMKRITDLVKNVRTQVAKDFEDKLKNGNTTSTVEIINGHKVIKNQTVYQDPHTFVKSVVFEVLPNEDDTTNNPTNGQGEVDTETPKRNKDREPLEDSVENEVSALNEGGNLNIETLEDNNIPPHHYTYRVDNAENEIESFEIIEPENLKNPDLLPPPIVKTESVENNVNPLPEGANHNVDLSNDIEQFNNFEPVDLSQDTRVNDILLKDGYPINPYAEMINLDEPKLVVT